jgi:phosphoribosylamine--glycine ligase
VVLAARGYPDAPELGEPITGLDTLPSGVEAFHAGTRRAPDGQLVTGGGRVLALVGTDRDAVYVAAERVSFAGKQFRTDIGLDVRALTGAGAWR